MFKKNNGRVLNFLDQKYFFKKTYSLILFYACTTYNYVLIFFLVAVESKIKMNACNVDVGKEGRK